MKLTLDELRVDGSMIQVTEEELAQVKGGGLSVFDWLKIIDMGLDLIEKIKGLFEKATAGSQATAGTANVGNHNVAWSISNGEISSASIDGPNDKWEYIQSMW